MWYGGDEFGTENVEHIDGKMKKVRSCAPFWTSFWSFEKTLTFKKVRTLFRSPELEKSVHEGFGAQAQSGWLRTTRTVFSSSSDRNVVLTFLKVNVFSNGQKLIQKGGQELTFSAFHRCTHHFHFRNRHLHFTSLNKKVRANYSNLYNMWILCRKYAILWYAQM